MKRMTVSGASRPQRKIQAPSQVSTGLEKKNNGGWPSAANKPHNLTGPCSPGKSELGNWHLDSVMESGGAV